MRLPLQDPVQAGLRRLARGHALVDDRLCAPGERHQGRLDTHRAAFSVCTTANVAGSRSNGSVPAMAANPSKAGPIEPAIRSATPFSTATPAVSAIALMCL